MTRIYDIAVLPGDGIGQEVMPQGLKALQAASAVTGGFSLRLKHFDWNSDYYVHHGRMMPADALGTLSQYDALYFGAIGMPQIVPDHITLWEFVLPLRQGFDQYVNLRPSRLLPGIRSPLRDKQPADVDLIVVRENTEGEYAGVGGRSHAGSPEEVAIETAVFSRFGVTRVMRFAFELARQRRHKLTSATKSNAWRYGMVLWDEIFAATAKDYPDVSIEKWHVDALAARMVANPETLDVVVASNLFGDILSDVAGAIQGSLGLAPSGNINPERKYPSLFEPVHGSAPDIFGRGIANPIAMVWAGVLMLDFLGETAAAKLLMDAIANTVQEGRVLTPDLGGTATTDQVGDALVEQIRQIDQGAH